MKTGIYKYIEYVEKNKKTIKIEDLLVKISFFQHERVVHFLVTSLVIICLIITLMFNLTLNNLGILILDIILFILSAFYLRYYYYLENGVQKLYEKYDEIKKLQ